MFRGAFQFGKKPAQPQYAPQPMVPAPQYVPQPMAPAPQYAPAQQPDDPEVAKMKAFFLRWLSIIIGGLALVLIVWRIALKFF